MLIKIIKNSTEIINVVESVQTYVIKDYYYYGSALVLQMTLYDFPNNNNLIN